VARLKAYKSNLVVFPRHRNAKKPKAMDNGSPEVRVVQVAAAGLAAGFCWLLAAGECITGVIINLLLWLLLQSPPRHQAAATASQAKGVVMPITKAPVTLEKVAITAAMKVGCVCWNKVYRFQVVASARDSSRAAPAWCGDGVRV
jgi:hypothetical protein